MNIFFMTAVRALLQFLEKKMKNMANAANN